MRDVDLREYYPAAVSETAEFDAIAEAENPEFNLLGEDTDELYAELFVSTAESYGLEAWEAMLGITIEDGDTVEDRRLRILTLLNGGDTPYTFRNVYNKLVTLCGENVVMEYANDEYTLSVKIPLASANQYNTVKEWLLEVIPANIALRVLQVYNTHKDLSRLTFAEMAKYTHEQLRTTVF